MRRNPGVVCPLAWMIMIWLGCGAGCETVPSAGPQVMGRGPMSFMVVESVPSGATVWLNDEERGATPVHLRIMLNEQGVIPTDMEIRLEWPDGRSDSTYTLPRGSLPQPTIRINSNGMLVQ